ncbi:MAG: hypothetical protein H6741_30635 [Alphaproteobacteria bacterium]|nr:hypothetical protein [Alphaproteobacteria bacterium]
MLTLALLSLSLAQDPAEEEGDDAGWGEGDDAGWGEGDEPTPPVKPPSPWSAGALLRSQYALWVQSREGSPLAKARQSADPWVQWREGRVSAAVSLHAEVDPAILLQQQDWDTATVEDYGWLVQPREARVALTQGPWQLELGRQRIAAGVGRGLSTQDIFTPRDLREPGLTDLEDLRLPITAARASWTTAAERGLVGSHQLEAVLIPEAWFGLRSPPKGPFGMLPGLLNDPETVANVGHLLDLEQLSDDLIVDYEHLQRRWVPSQVQGFLRWTWRGAGLDLSLLAGSALDQKGLLITPPLDDMLTAANLGEPVTIVLDHQRYTLLGHSGAAPVGPLLLRWEISYKHKLPINTGEGLTTLGMQPVLQVFSDTTDLLQGLAGLSWQGWGHTRVDLDLLQGVSPNPPYLPLFPVTIGAWSARGSKSFARERVELELLAMGWGWTARYGALGRAQVQVELRDGLHANIGYIHYKPGVENGPLLGLDHHDRVFMGLRWAI